MGPVSRAAPAGMRNVSTGFGANSMLPTIMNTKYRAMNTPHVTRSRAVSPFLSDCMAERMTDLLLIHFHAEKIASVNNGVSYAEGRKRRRACAPARPNVAPPRPIVARGTPLRRTSLRPTAAPPRATA